MQTTSPRYPRDMHGYGASPPDPKWPHGAKIAVQFVLNYEEGGENCVLHADAASEAFLSEVAGAQPWQGQRLVCQGWARFFRRADDEERAAFTDLNDAYVRKNGFPFIIAVRDYDKAGILEAFKRRLDHDRETEFAEACRLVERIARLRLEAMLS